MSLLNALQTASAQTESTTVTENVEVVVSTLTAPINGKFGAYRQFVVSGNTYNIDDSKVSNANFFRPNAKAVLTMQQYTSKKDGQVKTIVAGLSIYLPDGVAVLR